MALSVFGLKWISIVVMIVVAAIGSVALPLFLKHKSMNCVFGQSMAASILIMAALAHLLPEAAEDMACLGADPHQGGIFAGVICIATFFILIFIEEFAAHIWLVKKNVETPSTEEANTILREVESGDAEEGIRNPMHAHTEARAVEAPSSFVVPNTMGTSCTPNNNPINADLPLHSHCHGGDLSDDATTTAKLSVSAVCLFGALSFHSMVEGFALGYSREINNMALMLLSITCHKGLAGFALGQTLLQANYGQIAFAAMTTAFVLFSPIGLSIGWTLQFDGRGVGIGVINAIAAGTFLSISTYELLPQVFRKQGRLVEKATGILLGAGILA
eukprot:GEMP01032933.1.p1 GENE.GEMP01032933.1~~GEMP01032933.1.p1  ORF type:complete len:350 (+),score=63.79 GEMP01032933.1:58-1050(+)